MKAIVIKRLGGPEVLELQDAPKSEPKAGEALVRVEAVGINFADIMTAQGGYPGAPKPPLVAGREFCGTLEGSSKRVMGYAQWAAFAEKTGTAPHMLWPVPESWSDEQAAAFPVNYFTAYLEQFLNCYSPNPQWWNQAQAFFAGDATQGFRHSLLQQLRRSSFGGAQELLDFGPALLDRVQIG